MEKQYTKTEGSAMKSNYFTSFEEVTIPVVPRSVQPVEIQA
jgi:hypothetical protein